MLHYFNKISLNQATSMGFVNKTCLLNLQMSNHLGHFNVYILCHEGDSKSLNPWSPTTTPTNCKHKSYMYR